MASSRSRSDWLLRIAVTVAVATPLPTVREATAAPWPPRRTRWPRDAPEIRITAAIRPADHDDAGADVPDRRAGGPVAQLARGSRRARSRRRSRTTRRARSRRARSTPPASAISSAAAPSAAPSRSGGRRRQRVVEDEGDADRDQGERGQRDGASDQQAEPVLQPPADRADAEAQEERDPEEDRQRHQPQAHQLAGLARARAGRAGGGARGWRDGDGGCGVRAGCRWLPPGCRTRGAGAAGIPPEGDTPPAAPFLPAGRPRGAARGRGPLGSRGPSSRRGGPPCTTRNPTRSRRCPSRTRS